MVLCTSQVQLIQDSPFGATFTSLSNLALWKSSSSFWHWGLPVHLMFTAHFRDWLYPMTSIAYSEWDFWSDSRQSYHHIRCKKKPNSHWHLAAPVQLRLICRADAPFSLGMRSLTSYMLSLQTSSLWLIALTSFWRFMEHCSVLEASDFLTDLASDVTVLRAIWMQASSSSMQVQDQLLANEAVAVDIISAYGSQIHPSGGVKRSTMQLIKQTLIWVLSICFPLSCQVRILVGPAHICDYGLKSWRRIVTISRFRIQIWLELLGIGSWSSGKKGILSYFLWELRRVTLRHSVVVIQNSKRYRRTMSPDLLVYWSKCQLWRIRPKW